MGHDSHGRVGVAMEMITQAFQQTFTLQWALYAIPVAFVLSLLVSRIALAPILAVVAMVAQHSLPIALPMMAKNAPNDTIMTAVSAALQKVDPLVAAMEFVAFIFFIAVFSLTRRDMFRVKPDA